MSSAPSPDLPPVPASARHSLFDDVQALATSILFLGLSILLFRQAGLLTGGVTGLSFILHYATGLPFGALFFALNVPFYLFAWKALGRVFTLKSGVAVVLLSLCSELVPHLIEIGRVDPLYATVMGGLLTGTGLLMLIRHRGSLGGIGVLALFLQQKYGWRAGWVQLAMDCVILSSALLVVEPRLVLLSVIGAVVLNAVLAVNHRPGLYAGM